MKPIYNTDTKTQKMTGRAAQAGFTRFCICFQVFDDVTQEDRRDSGSLFLSAGDVAGLFFPPSPTYETSCCPM